MSNNSRFTPPQFENYHCVGWISSAHGIRGEVFVRLYAGESEWHHGADKLHLLLKGGTSPAAFEIQKISSHKDGLIVKFGSVRDRNEAEALAKAGVYVDLELLQSEEGEPVFLKQIEGFEVVDPKGVCLGKITGFASNGPQDLLEIQPSEGPIALVPLVDAFLVHIDFDKQQVTMDLPPGLLNLED